MQNQPTLAAASLRIAVISILLVGIVLSCGLGYQVFDMSQKRAEMQTDFAKVNSIEYGIFSATNWKDKIISIIEFQIDDFELTPKQDSLMRVEVEQLLHKMIDEAERQVSLQDKSFKNKIRKVMINVLVDWDQIRKQVPTFTSTIMREVTSQKSKERLKALAKSKVDEYAEQIYDDSTSVMLKQYLHKYEVDSQDEMNDKIAKESQLLDAKSFWRSYILAGIAAVFLMLWLVARQLKLKTWYRPMFVLSVVMSMVLLLVGISSPMIEIDARIAQIDFTLLGEHILFKDQMLFYRSKSILEIVQILMKTGKADTLFVGGLIFLFSVVLPLSKLIATQVFLIGGKLRKTVLVDWLVFRSGKWSMADVMVVAIFMSFVGFNGILDSQLKIVEVDSQTLTSIATNLTSLQPGFFVFLAFVLFSLMLAQMLKWSVEKREL